MTTTQLVPTLLIPFIAWRVYARVRRTVGRQPFRPGRLIFRAVFFSLILALVSLTALRSSVPLGALGGGLALAVVLSLVALRLTRFEHAADGKFYTPNTIIGLVVTLLFIGRLAYRFSTITDTMPGTVGTPAMFQSPLTLFTFGITAGFYVAYSLGLLVRGQKPA